VNHLLPQRSATRRQCCTSTIPIYDVSRIQDYEDELEVQDTNVWTLQVQQVEQDWMIKN
jgi:hypothetical protein